MNIDIDKLFQELRNRCVSKNVYSVREIAKSMGVNYDFIELCASMDEEKNEVLQFCRSSCACNVMQAGIYNKMPLLDVSKYLTENDDDFARKSCYETILED